MNRRRLLKSIGGVGMVGVGGCTSLDSPLRGGSSENVVQREVQLVDQDTVPETYEIEIEAVLLQTTITAEQTARVEITATNQGPGRYISISHNRCSLFDRMHGGSDDPPGLWLHTPEYSAEIPRKNDRWERDQSPDRKRKYHMYKCDPKKYESSESVKNTYSIWDDYRTDGYLQPGVYHWEEEVIITTSENVSKQSARSFQWGFSIKIEKP